MNKFHGLFKQRALLSNLQSRRTFFKSQMLRSTEVQKTPENSPIQKPSKKQLRIHFFTAAIPMFAFGWMDNTVMIQAGELIDDSLGGK